MSYIIIAVGPVVKRPVMFQLLSFPTVYPPTFSINCTTIMFPPTTISWFLDQSLFDVRGMNSAYQNVRNALTTTYDSVLTVSGGQAGTYRCTASNSRGSDSAEIFVDGM